MDQEGDQWNKSCSSADDEQFVVVSDAERMSIRASDPKLVANFLFPKRSANGPPLLDHNTRLRSPMNGQHAHGNLINPWDPNHGKLAGLGVVQSGVAEPERAD